MKLPLCGCLLKMLQRPAKNQEQGKKGACKGEPSVLVTLYVVKPTESLNPAARNPTGLKRHRRHRQGIGPPSAGSGGGGGRGGGYNRKEELLLYCRHLRMSVVDPPPSAPPAHQCQRFPPQLHLPNEPPQHDQGKRLLKKMLTSVKKKKMKNIH